MLALINMIIYISGILALGGLAYLIISGYVDNIRYRLGERERKKNPPVYKSIVDAPDYCRMLIKGVGGVPDQLFVIEECDLDDVQCAFRYNKQNKENEEGLDYPYAGDIDTLQFTVPKEDGSKEEVSIPMIGVLDVFCGSEDFPELG